MRGVQADRSKPTVTRGVWHIPSFSSRRKTYHVRYSSIYGRWVCDCDDYYFRHANKNTDCKHVRQVKEIIDTWSMEELEAIKHEH